VGHIVGMRPPDLFSWLAAAAACAGVLVVILGRTPLQQRLGIALALVGVGATAYDIVQRSQAPPRPNLVVRLVSPGRRTGRPVLVQICGSTRRGRPTPPLADGRHLVVRLDGVQVAEVRVTRVVIPSSFGLHELLVEVTNAYHQGFAPPIIIRRRLDVVRHGPEATSGGCSG